MTNVFLRILVGALAFVVACMPAHAQSTRAQLQAQITSTMPDNTAGAITPSIVRNMLNAMVLSGTCVGANQTVVWNSSLVPTCVSSAAVYPDSYCTVDRTGASDMGACINSAIVAASSCGTSGNATVTLRAGAYLITTPISPKSCVSIQGDGMGKTVLLTNHATPLLQTSGADLVHFNLKGVTFKDSGAHPGATAMTFQVIKGSRIENIGFHGYTTGTAMNLSSNAVTISVYDDNTGVWPSVNSFFNTFADWVIDDTMAIGIILAGSLATPCNTNTATNVVTLNVFKDIQFWGITGVGWDLVRANDTNQFIGVNIIRLIGNGATVTTPHASFKNIGIQLGDDNVTCAGNNDVALERIQVTMTMAAPATSFTPFNAGNTTFGHDIDFQTDQSPSVMNGGFTAQAGVAGFLYFAHGRNWLSTFDDGAGNLRELELTIGKYFRIDDGTSAVPMFGFSNDLANGFFRGGTGIFGFGKGTTTLQMNGSSSGSFGIGVSATGSPQYGGTATNDNAPAGNVGEYISSSCTGTANTATVTITIAAPGVITWASHGFLNTSIRQDACPVVFTTSGALPTGFTAGTTYYVAPSSISGNNFSVATTVANAIAGTLITTSGSQSGTQTGTAGANPANTTAKNVTGIALTAGDWDVSISAHHTETVAAAVVNYLEASISTTADTLDTGPGKITGQSYLGSTPFNFSADAITLSVAPFRLSLSATTNVFFVTKGSFASQLGVAGVIQARRQR